MIDYTQDAFAHPALVLDPVPSISDYLDDYRARNEAWYRSFAFPLGEGRFGARPSSFERRGLPSEPASAVLPDPEALPPIIQDAPPEDNRVLAGDRPVGAIVRDVRDMTDAEIMAEGDFLAGPGQYAGSVASLFAGPGTGFGFVGGPMARSSVNDRLEGLVLESLIRGLPGIPGQDYDPPESPMITRVGTPTITPIEPRESGSHQQGPRDYERGGEDQFDAGGWRGGGGI